MYSTCASSQKVLDVEKVNQSPLEDRLHLTCASSRIVLNVEKTKQFFLPCKRIRKIDDAKTIPSIITRSYAEDVAKKTYTSRTIKLSAKTKNARRSFLFSQKFLEQSLEIVENLIICLSHLLEAWKDNIKDIAVTVMVTQTRENLEPEDKDFLGIWVTKINLTNTTPQDQFIYFTQLDIREPEIYSQAM